MRLIRWPVGFVFVGQAFRASLKGSPRNKSVRTLNRPGFAGGYLV